MILTGIAFVYFVGFPADLTAVLVPVRELVSLTNAFSPWVYGVVAAGVIAWALVRCFGRSQDVAAR